MIAVPRLGDRIAPRAQEVLSIGERSRYLFVLRAGLAAAPVVQALIAPEEMLLPVTAVLAGSVLYLSVSSIPHLLERGSRTLVLPLLRGMLLLDGIFLAGIMAISGGVTGPLRFLALVHVVAVILLFSYRSGLKLALWHSLLYLLVVYSEPLGLLGEGEGAALTAAVERTALVTLVVLWVAALGTATFAALSERELRRQKIDLERLSAMLAQIQTVSAPKDIARIMLGELCRTFSFRRGVVLAAPGAGLTVMATTEDVVGDAELAAMEPLAFRARSERKILAVRTIDPRTDPTLAVLLPEARNVLVVPLIGDRGRSVGLVVLERGGGEHGIRRWVVGMVEQFASQAALALNNAWLSEERELRIEEIQELQDRLEAHNADLELKVAERTAELRTAIERLKEGDDQRRRLFDHVVRAGEEERARIAGDIHDDPVQKLVALKMRLELLAKARPELREIPEARDLVLVCIRSLRHLLFDLRPPVLDERGLGAALRSFLENAQVAFRWAVIDELDDEPPPQARLILYRIAQEALTNARKHAQAEHVTVTLRGEAGGIAMEITDDGVGFAPKQAVVAAPGHMGLAAIRERAELAGGRCELHSLPGEGTTFDIWLPTAAEDRQDVSIRISPDEIVLLPPPEASGLGVNGSR